MDSEGGAEALHTNPFELFMLVMMVIELVLMIMMMKITKKRHCRDGHDKIRCARMESKSFELVMLVMIALMLITYCH